MNNPEVLKFDELKLGQTASFEIILSENMITDFTKFSGDRNPLHTDNEYAKEVGFKEKIGHGMIIGSLFSKLIGMHLPGKYSVYLSQDLRFHKPIKINDIVQIRGTIEQISTGTKTVKILTEAINKKNGEIFVNGEARVKLLK